MMVPDVLVIPLGVSMADRTIGIQDGNADGVLDRRPVEAPAGPVRCHDGDR
jgi:hypothetical protein